jgi:hypothetical protein
MNATEQQVWFNFDLDKWNAFDDFDPSRPFVWCYPPKPNSQSK